MPRTLRYLVKAKTGSFPTTGQSAKTLLGASSGDRGSDWFISSWAYGGSEPSESPAFPYSDGHSFAMTFTITRGSKASQIQRTGSVLGITPSGPAGFSAVLTTNSVVGATGSVTVQVTAPYYNNSASVVAGQHWFRDYTYPTEPPPGAGTLPVTMRAQISGASGTGQQNVAFTIYYKPDTADADQFNPNLTKTYSNIPFYNRPEAVTDFEIEWHLNSSYTNLAHTGASFEEDSDPLESWTYYLRYRRIGETSWVNVGAQTWNDPRLT
jgi:hypothetical protein